MISRTQRTLLGIAAAVTRRFRPRGTERLLRLLHHPDRRDRGAIREIVPYDRGLRIAVDTSDFIEWSIFFYGHYEPPVARFIRRGVPAGGSALDIGANVGCHTLLMAAAAGPQGTVAAYEPHPRSWERLQSNLDLNGFNQVQAVRAAVSDRAGEAELYGPAGAASRGVASFYRGNVAGAPELFPVTVTTLDLEVQRLELDRLDLIKIDTEGNELNVLRGGLETLSRFRPVIVMEYSPRTWSAAQASLDDAAGWLGKLDYRLSLIPGGKGDLSGRVSADLAALPGKAGGR